jgi:small subunit ribosomal protein S20
MANSKSAKKNILINKRNKTRNNHFKSKMKTLVKKAILAIESNVENKIEALKEALKTIDKTASAGIIKKTTAARKKSRLTLFFNKISSGKIDTVKAEPKKKAVKAVAKKATPVKKEKAPVTKKTTAKTVKK